MKLLEGWFSYLSAFTASIVVFSSGVSFTWTSPVFQKLESTDLDENPFGEPIEHIQESWTTSLLFLGCTVGPVIAGFLVDRIGRKYTLLTLAVPMIIGYVMLAFATNFILYYVARFILGLGVGSCFAITPMYLVEISEDHNRGLFLCIMTVFLALGLLYSFAVGPYLSIKIFSLSCVVPLILFMAIFLIFFPESPIYLVIIGDTKKSKGVLKTLRQKSSHEIDNEITEITKALQEMQGQKGGIIKMLKTVSLRNALMISMGLVILQQCSGINAVLAYMGLIFDATGSTISPYVCTVGIGVLQILFTIITALVVEKLGRRVLLMFSTTVTGVSVITLGLYFYLKYEKKSDVTGIFWLPVVSCIAYVIAFNAGLAQLPWTMMGELFPPYDKSVGSTITTCTCFITSFCVTLSYPLIEKNIGTARCFWIYGFFCFLGTIFAYFKVPETKGKSASEIQKILSGNRGGT